RSSRRWRRRWRRWARRSAGISRPRCRRASRPARRGEAIPVPSDGRRMAARGDFRMRTLKLAYSDDADDAAMFLAMVYGEVAVPGVRFEHFRSDIATLNALADAGGADVCAVSVAHVPEIADRYAL